MLGLSGINPNSECPGDSIIFLPEDDFDFGGHLILRRRVEICYVHKANMKKPLIYLTAVFLLCVFSDVANAQSGDTSAIRYPKLRQTLLEMVQADQAVRMAMLEKGPAHIDSLDVARQDSVDEANQACLEGIIQRYGWPTGEMVGQDGVNAVFLIVQHGDLGFQKAMLPHVRKAFEAGELAGQDWALLTDRVLRKEGLPQRYGTQVEVVDGKVIVEPLENEEKVDAWRAELGLPPLADYIKILEKMYGQVDQQ
ncbi:DUF6624 domain-containing protein [Rhodocaloribacter sp.]